MLKEMASAQPDTWGAYAIGSYSTFASGDRADILCVLGCGAAVPFLVVISIGMVGGRTALMSPTMRKKHTHLLLMGLGELWVVNELPSELVAEGIVLWEE